MSESRYALWPGPACPREMWSDWRIMGQNEVPLRELAAQRKGESTATKLVEATWKIKQIHVCTSPAWVFLDWLSSWNSHVNPTRTRIGETEKRKHRRRWIYFAWASRRVFRTEIAVETVDEGWVGEGGLFRLRSLPVQSVMWDRAMRDWYSGNKWLGCVGGAYRGLKKWAGGSLGHFNHCRKRKKQRRA